MADYIDRQAAIEMIHAAAENWNFAEPYNEGMRAGYRSSARIVLGMPSADVRDNRVGWWAYGWNQEYVCSNCHTRFVLPDNGSMDADLEHYNFCPNCGCAMRGRE